MRRTVISSFTLVLILGAVRAVQAAPSERNIPPPPVAAPESGASQGAGSMDPFAGSGAANAPAALRAAYGTPPAQGEFSPDTHADPGYVDRQGAGVADRPYGSTAKTVAPDGSVVDGLMLYEAQSLAGDEGLVDDGNQFHVVRDGDTLWGISGYYLEDPYLWPKLWSWNEQLTNPHWIFPGDRIRLGQAPYAAGTAGPVASAGPGIEFSRTQLPQRSTPQSYMLNQVAYVDAEKLDSAMKVTGSGEAKTMLSTLDTVYMSYNAKRPPIPGERLVVYAPQRAVHDAKGKKVLGYVVEVMGEVEVGSLSGQAAEGVVMNAFNPIERGYRVGPLRRQFRRIDRREAQTEATGRIVSTLTSTGPMPIGGKRRRKKLTRQRENVILVGEDQFVVTDLGAEDGVEAGNMLEVVRRGDAYMPKRAFKLPYKDGWPRRVIGAVLVVDVEPQTSLGVIVYARQEIERGDHVALGKAAGAEVAQTGLGTPVAGEGTGTAADGRVQARGSVSLGSR